MQHLFPVKSRLVALLALLALAPVALHAQSTSNLSEDFTGTSTSNNWFFYNGACLTAGTDTSLLQPGKVPACTTVLNTYYNVADPVSGKKATPYLTGGNSGYLGGSTAPSSPSGSSPTPVVRALCASPMATRTAITRTAPSFRRVLSRPAQECRSPSRP